MEERLDASAVKRVLDRAHEIERRRGAGDDDLLDADTLVEAAAEVGYDPSAVRDSLALERFTIGAADGSALDRVVGPALVVTEREIGASPREALDRIEAWLSGVHRLRCDRRRHDLLIATRRSDTAARLGRTSASLRGEGGLGRVRRLTVEAVPQTGDAAASRGGGRCVVRIEVDRTDDRGRRTVGGAALGTTGVASALIGVAEAVAWWPAVALPAIVTGAVVATGGARRSTSTELDVERLLTAVDREDRPRSIVDRIRRRHVR